MKWFFAAAVVVIAMGVTVALADPGNLTLVGSRSASGRKAHAVLVVPKLGSHRFKKVTMEVSATPPQRVSAGYVGSCVRGGIGGLRPSEQKSGRTPLSITLILDEYDYSDYCSITAEATLTKKGRVTVQVVGRG